MTPRECERAAAKLERDLKYIEAVRLRNPSFTLWGGRYNTVPIGAAGVIIFQPGVGEAWLRGSIRMEADKLTRYRCAIAIRKRLRQVIEEHKLRRVQMMVETTDEPTPAAFPPWLETRPTMTPQLKFALWLKFRVEGLMRKAGPNGENYYMLALVT